VDFELITALLQSGIIIYGIFQITIALTAVVLSVKWSKFEFLAGLSFLLIYTIVFFVDMFLFTFMYDIFLDAAQFGFILLAIVFFIIGMHPTWAPRMTSIMTKQSSRFKSPRNESAISILRKF
jgi:hypothetical protein